MNRRKPTRKPPVRNPPPSDIPPMPPDFRPTEQAMAQLGRLLREREFASIEEVNAFLQESLASGGLPPAPPQTPLEEAEELIYEALKTPGPRRVQLARKALEISPDCADGYVILAQEAARTPQEALELFEQGVKAGERALGPEAFEEAVGHFWASRRHAPTCGRARAWREYSGCWASAGRPSSSTATCSASTPTTTRASATSSSTA